MDQQNELFMNDAKQVYVKFDETIIDIDKHFYHQTDEVNIKKSAACELARKEFDNVALAYRKTMFNV